jgi:hypothetical protein
MSEEERAAWLRTKGARVVHRHGRHWRQLPKGFYQAALCEDSAAQSSVPVHLLSDVLGYDEGRLSSNRRYHLRKCRRRVEIVEVLDPSLLERQGYEVVLSAAERIGYFKAPSRARYLASLAKYVDPAHRLVLAGLLDGKLGGYLSGYAVDGTAYVERVHVATEALKSDVSLGLTYDFVQACRRSSEIREVVDSQHMPENPALGVFKESVGFPVVHVPTKVVMNPFAARVLRRRRPYAYYRLTGRTGIDAPAPFSSSF